MRFLVDASLPRSVAPMLRSLGHEAVDRRDISMRSATDDVVAAHARGNQPAPITRDCDFADIRNYPPADGETPAMGAPRGDLRKALALAAG